jgi:hypothetical protein
LAIGDWRLLIDDWRLAIGDWRLASFGLMIFDWSLTAALARAVADLARS